MDAHVKAVVHGRAYLMGNNIELPFTIEKRLGAACYLGNIHFDKEKRAVVGEIVDPRLDLGEHFVFQFLNQGLSKLAEKQIHRFNPVPILKKDQVEDMVAPAGGPLKLKMGVEDIALEVTEENLSLKVRFGFTQLQLTGS